MYTCKLTYSGKTYINSHASAFEAMEGTIDQVAADKGWTKSFTIDELAHAEQTNQLTDVLELDGVAVEQADHL